MNIEDAIYRGYLAWSPSPSTTNLDVWVDDHVPMAGTLMIEGATIAFSAILEPTEAVSVWIYAELNPAEVAFLGDHVFEDVHDADDYLNSVFSSRPVAYATTRDYRIRQFSLCDLKGRSPVKGALDFLRMVSDALTLMAPKSSDGSVVAKSSEVEQIDVEAEKFKRLVSA